MESGIELILNEQIRQRKLGYTAEHDNKETCGQLAIAAACYAADTTNASVIIINEKPHNTVLQTPLNAWPWEHETDKRGHIDRIRQLSIAGALIASEIDRLQRSYTDR